MELSVKKPELLLKIDDAVINPEEYNLAELISFELAKITEDAIKFCKKKKIVGQELVNLSRCKIIKIDLIK